MKLKVAAIAASVLLAGAASASVTVTFPQSAITAASSNVYQFTSNLTSGGMLQLGSTVAGFGRIDSFNGTPINTTGGAGSFCNGCELTYVYDGFSFSGYTSNNKLLFTGGQFRLFADFTPDAITISSTTFLSAGGPTAWNNALASYGDGFQLLTSTARATNISVPGSTTTVSGFGGCPAGFTGTNYDFGTNTTTCASASISIPATLFVDANGLSGQSAFDALSGAALNNFAPHNTQSLSPFGPPAILSGADLSQSTTIPGLTSCFPNPSSTTYQLCLGVLSVTSFVTPTTVTLVPEPGSLALFGLSIVGLGAAVARRRRQQAQD